MADSFFSFPDCKLFVDADMSKAELLGMVAQLLFESGTTLRHEVEIIDNEDYDSERRKGFPGGFIYFRYAIDLYFEDTPLADRAALVAHVLEELWSWGFPAVAACSYEGMLPHGGGYKSLDIPWPD